ncbi:MULTISPECIES: hypothetical protein [Streptomyces]|uniref:hypothetical protein n=1 Tax=Streptomyces TaxID=1883 RepID=UPI0005E674AE|nr:MULTISPECIES: hypothetical protein [unclassified Streptomyces]OLO25986.1 hypothetical protein PZ61_0237015 [Streptomyces sp. MNU77]WEH37908.1 hypothetical protein PZB75_31395 [Streptomyces sp. AM 4-1-1]
MGIDPNFAFLKAFFAARIDRLRDARDDRGAISIETMMIIAGLVVAAGVAVAVIATKISEKAATIK